MKYRALLDHARWTLPGGFLENLPPSAPVLDQAEFEWRGRGTAVDEATLARTLAAEMARHDADKPEKSDTAMALAVHRSLPLSRRDAADKSLWWGLHASAGWNYLRWRWENNGCITKERAFVGMERSALGRLWWIAELCRGQDKDAVTSDAEWTRRIHAVVDMQDRMNNLYGRPLVLARRGLTGPLLEVAGASGLDESGFRRFMEAVGSYFGTRLVAAMDKAVVLDTVKRLEAAAHVAPE